MSFFSKVRRAVEEGAGHNGENGLLAPHEMRQAELMRWLGRRTSDEYGTRGAGRDRARHRSGGHPQVEDLRLPSEV